MTAIVLDSDLLRIRDAAHSCITIRASDRVIVYAAPLLEMNFGYSQGELTGKVLESLVPDDKKLIHVSYVDGYLENPKPRAMGFPNGLGPTNVKAKMKDGTERPVTIGLHPRFEREVLYVTATILFRLDN